MEARQTPLQACLNKHIQYTIPVFQRTYSWTLEQTSQLFKDILRLAENPDIPMHFLGSLVYVQGGLYTTATVVELIVIDGQQRLTTITLFLAALASHFMKHGDEQTAKEIRGLYLLNDYTSDSQKYKLLLTQNDKNTLINLVEGKELQPPISNRLAQNYNYLLKSIENAKVDPRELYQAFKKLIVVDVSLDRTTDNPQLIFESLNSTGLDLSQADLIRNYVLMGLSKENQDELYNDYWRPMELDFGETNYTEYFDQFMRDYLTMKTGRIPKISEVYHEFKKYAPQNDYQTMKVVISDVQKYSKYYSAFALGNELDTELGAAFADLRTLKVDVVYPFLLEVCGDFRDAVIDKAQLIQIIKMIESYVFRRMICGIPTNSLNKTFANLSKEIDRTDYLQSLQAIMILKTSYRVFPTDETFRRDFVTTDIYHKLRADYIFDKLENFDRREKVTLGSYSIEHIMPQNTNLSTEWRADLGDNWQEIHDTYLNTIGNLTITAYNSTYSDRPFLTKRDLKNSDGTSVGFGSSPFHLNEGLGSLEHWNEQEITRRAEKIASLALTIWSYPKAEATVLEKYQQQSNKEEIEEVYNSLGAELDDRSDKLISTDEILQTIEDPLASEKAQAVFDYCAKLPDVTIHHTTNKINFKCGKIFASIYPQKRQFWVDIKWVANDPKKLLQHNHPVYGHVRVFEEVELPDVFALIDQAYSLVLK